MACGWAAPWPRPLPIHLPIRSSGSSATTPHWLGPGPQDSTLCGDVDNTGLQSKLTQDTRTGRLESTQKGSHGPSSPGNTEKPRKELKIYPHPTLPFPSPPLPTPRHRAGSQHSRPGAREVPLCPQVHGHTVDKNLYMDTDTQITLQNTALPWPGASSCHAPSCQDPFPGRPTLIPQPGASQPQAPLHSLRARGARLAEAARPPDPGPRQAHAHSQLHAALRKASGSTGGFLGNGMGSHRRPGIGQGRFHFFTASFVLDLEGQAEF